MRRLLPALLVIALLLTALPAFAETSSVTDPVLAKLEALIAGLTALQKDVAALQQKTDALQQKSEALQTKLDAVHKTVVGDPAAPPTAFVIRADGTKPIAVAEGKDDTRAELLQLKETDGGDVVATIRIKTGPNVDTYNYCVEMETGRKLVETKDNCFGNIPAATTREAEFVFQDVAGQLTPDGYIKVYAPYKGWGVRLPFVQR